ncbi:MAG TPA: hypothetical protein VG820_11125 [Fimbriimonadaceae bacterium]|nr:hypothetical protein [Fimbriimonadaceae bacterium]
MKHLIICLGIIIGLFNLGHAQTTAEQGKKSDEVVMKMRQIDLLNQIVPLALKKDQINALLPVIERARAKVAQVEKDEANTLAKLDSKISAAIKKSIEENTPPPKELSMELAKATQDMSDRRLLVVSENTEAVLKVFNDTLDAGQKKVAANSFAAAYINPNVKPDEIKESEKINFFIREVLLDPQAYDLLIELAKHVS